MPRKPSTPRGPRCPACRQPWATCRCLGQRSLFDLLPATNKRGFPRAVRPDNPALDGLKPDTIRAITGRVTPEMVQAFVGCLIRGTARPVDAVRRELCDEPWFIKSRRPDTQRRFLRRLRDRAIAAGYPICSMNRGYLIGNKQQTLRSADRADNLADGATRRATALRSIAAKMSDDDPDSYEPIAVEYAEVDSEEDDE